MSASMNLFILFCQIVSSPAVMSIFSIFVHFSKKHPADPDVNLVISVKVLATIYGIWNLDFFRTIYEPFCLHPNMSVFQVMSLDYAIAVYPMFLICLTYLLIKFHDKFNIVQLLWKPAAWLITHFSHQWRVSNSLIEAFGTFILLSYVKITNISFDILMPVQLYNCLLYTSPSPRDATLSRMPSSA